MSVSAADETVAMSALVPGIAAKINALHADARCLETESRKKLHAAVSAAWQVGKLLREAKASVTRHGGRGAWTPWIKTLFAGDMRTAQRYMKLARELPGFNPAAPGALSLRQIYFRLGIATEPKRAAAATRSHGQAGRLPAHITLANKLVRVLRHSRRDIRPHDLAPLYTQLRALFEPDKITAPPAAPPAEGGPVRK
jgi:hypothetical protein